MPAASPARCTSTNSGLGACPKQRLKHVAEAVMARSRAAATQRAQVCERPFCHRRPLRPPLAHRRRYPDLAHSALVSCDSAHSSLFSCETAARPHHSGRENQSNMYTCLDNRMADRPDGSIPGAPVAVAAAVVLCTRGGAHPGVAPHAEAQHTQHMA